LSLGDILILVVVATFVGAKNVDRHKTAEFIGQIIISRQTGGQKVQTITLAENNKMPNVTSK